MSGSWQAGFTGLIAPVDLATFRAEIQGRAAHHFAGESDRFAALFSWQTLERLLSMTQLWSERTMNLVLDGRAIAAEEYTRAASGREGATLAMADMARVDALMARGATLVLDRVECLVPELAPILRALSSAFGAAVVCNVYCSWQSHPGFASHFDTTDVFALHIAGVKRWRIYEGRAHHPTPAPGHQFSDFDAAHHTHARGACIAEVEMTPGDVLYLPRGQYHDALASSEASLHLSFGVTRATGLDFMQVLNASLPDDDVMRAEFPHFDDHQATAEHLRALADRLATLVADPELVEQAVAWQRERVFRDRGSSLHLPQRGQETWVRVRHGAAESPALDERVTRLYRWMCQREVFAASDLLNELGLDEAAARAVLDDLAGRGLIEAL